MKTYKQYLIEIKTPLADRDLIDTINFFARSPNRLTRSLYGVPMAFNKKKNNHLSPIVQQHQQNLQNELINDKDANVRAKIAEHGTDEHRDMLINDQDPYVRENVAKYGNFKHKKALWNDPDLEVRKAARE